MGKNARKAAATRRPSLTILAGLAIVVVLVVLLAIQFVQSGSSAPTPGDEGPLSSTVLANVTNVPPAVLATVGAGTAAGDIRWLPGPTRNGDTGKPLVVYVGAEYCPFCAVERWPLVVALSRFGAFQNLAGSFSASDDVYPSTPTFTFVGSSYTSQYVAFSSVEAQSNKKVNGVYPPLQTPTALQNEVFQRFNGPPFLAQNQAGGIPFIDVADHYMANGATYDPRVLGGLSRDAIAAKLQTADNDQARGILGAANRLTAAICVANANQPTSVCADPSIQQIETTLPKQPTG